MKLVFSPQSRKDLTQIKNYISTSLSSPHAAENNFENSEKLPKFKNFSESRSGNEK